VGNIRLYKDRWQAVKENERQARVAVAPSTNTTAGP